MFTRIAFILGFLVLAPFVLAVEWLAYPLVPIAVRLADPAGRLPRGFQWLETHDNLGWYGPLTEGYPATKWGLIRWLWRNKAYTLRDLLRVDPPLDAPVREYGRADQPIGFSYYLVFVGDAFQLQVTLGLPWFRLYVNAGWKLKAMAQGYRPSRPSSVGILIPVSIRTGAPK